MKVIDLLNKIANGEEVPKKVKYKGLYWEYDKNYDDYRDNEDDWVFGMSNYDITRMLNNEVEILEESKGIPKKINCWYNYNGTDDKELTKIMLDELKDKYNEIIDYLESKGE